MAAARRSLAGLVLAGGSGSRLGRPKATIVVRGRTLVERAVELLSARCDPVIVVSRPDVPLPSLDVPVVFDRKGVRGPMNALATGLAALDTDDVLVLACDLPFTGPVLDRLAAAPRGRAVAARDDRLQPLCARYPREATLEACRKLASQGVRRMTSLLITLDTRSIEAGADELFNVNTPEDLDAARLRPPT
ncbi:MAG TPA: molybdenum cofactor guanylyltransferase [Acidimicrobiales bacterium]|nr:molybdenum cofactor guanylyltransferase [Acidimicrobiales bacterium]